MASNNSDIMNELRSLQAQVMHFKDLLSEEGEKVPATRAAVPPRC